MKFISAVFELIMGSLKIAIGIALAPLIAILLILATISGIAHIGKITESDTNRETNELKE